MFDTVTNTFGYNAKWTPSNEETEQSAKVLYKDATESQTLSEQDYNIEDPIMEYKKGDFLTLQQLVSEGIKEKVKIELTTGVFTEFIIRRIESKYDGKTILAFLNPPV